MTGFKPKQFGISVFLLLKDTKLAENIIICIIKAWNQKDVLMYCKFTHYYQKCSHSSITLDRDHHSVHFHMIWFQGSIHPRMWLSGWEIRHLDEPFCGATMAVSRRLQFERKFWSADSRPIIQGFFSLISSLLYYKGSLCNLSVSLDVSIM